MMSHKGHTLHVKHQEELASTAGYLSFQPFAQSVVLVLKGHLARHTRVTRLARAASIAQRSRRLRSTLAAAPVLLAHAEVTKNINIFSMGPKLRCPAVA